MKFRPPTSEDIRAAAADIGLEFDEDESRVYLALTGSFAQGLDVLDAISDEPPALRQPRDSGHRPTAAENPHNAWYWRTSITEAPGGKLAGRTLALKDNVMLAGVPMMHGTSLLEGYVPEMDATIVTRILEAGGTIAGKAHCEGMCVSGGSHTNATGPVHNPRRRGYSAGGSSSGSAALVAAGDVDMAIGGDQGGSIRMPASFCGIYGLKPTFGLVPYTGVLPIEPTLDHVGPMTRTVRDAALLLEVIAGADGLDPRQQAPIVHPYGAMLEGGIAGLRIGILREGFGLPTSQSGVDDAVRAAGKALAGLGAVAEEISVPMHLYAGALVAPLVSEGVLQTMLDGGGGGSGRLDLYVPSLVEKMHGWRARARELPETVKVAAVLATYLRKQHGTYYYAKAMNLRRQVRAAYDEALGRVDLLLLPTTPMMATPIPGPDASREEILQRAFEPTTNTGPFNLTHHPAMSVPCGDVDGLPVGMMLVGKHFDEPTILRAAYTFEQSGTAGR